MSTPGLLRDFAAATTRGLRRESNEDALAAAGALLTGEIVRPLRGELEQGGRGVLAVADGMGGHAHGALASREVAAKLLAETARLTEPDGCITAVRQADLHLHTLMLQRPESAGMGTTIAGIAVQGSSFCWFNVGDSRIYRLRGERLEQISVDDRQPAQAGAGPRDTPHGVVQSLGGRLAIAPIHPHAGRVELLAGDRLLLCSDGLTDMVPDASIAHILGARTNPAAAAQRLLDAALQAGGLDNVSVILVQ